MRGSGMLGGRTGRRSELAQIDGLLYLVENLLGRSAVELAQAIHGEGVTELRVQQDLVRLVSTEEIERRGIGSLTGSAHIPPDPVTAVGGVSPPKPLARNALFSAYGSQRVISRARNGYNRSFIREMQV